MYGKEVEIEPQADIEEEADVPPSRQKSNAVSRSSSTKVKTESAAPRTARPLRSNALEEERYAAQKTPAQKQQVKRDTCRGAAGIVDREMEALARLMASF
jgi:hypothetical protein